MQKMQAGSVAELVRMAEKLGPELSKRMDEGIPKHDRNPRA
jgi:hypothetical protein